MGQELQRLHASLTLKTFIHDSKMKMNADTFFDDLQKFTKRQYLKQKYKVYSLLRIEFKDDISILMDANIAFGDNGQKKSHSKTRQFQSISSSSKSIKSQLNAKNRRIRRMNIEQKCRKPTLAWKIMDETYADIEKAERIQFENEKLEREIEAIKFFMDQHSAQYHAPVSRAVHGSMIPNYAANELQPQPLTDEHVQDEKLLFPDGTMLIDEEGNNKNDNVSIGNSSLSTPMIQPFGGYTPSHNLGASTEPFMINQFNESMSTMMPSFALNSAFSN